MLEGEKINIRPMEEHDLKPFFRWSLQTGENSFFLNDKNDVEIYSYLQLQKDFRDKRALALIPPLPLVIEDHSGKIAGFFRFTIYPGDDRNALMSIAFVNQEHFFNELEGEAGDLILNYFFNRKNLFRVYTRVIEEESGSLDYLRGFGFELEGLQKDQIFLEGRYLNLCTLGILRDEAKSVKMVDGAKNDREEGLTIIHDG